MSLADLESGDSLRIVKHSDGSAIAEFFVIVDDTIEEDLIDSDVSVNIPVYGTPFLIVENPEGAKYTKAEIKLEGPASAFDSVVSQCASPTTFQLVRLVIGGNLMDQTDFVKGVVTGVSRKRNVTRGDSWVEGSISFISIP